MFKFDLTQTLAFAAVVLYLGYTIRRFVPVLGRYNIPAPVIGGMLISLLVLAARWRGVTLFEFDTTLKDPLMIAFFTSIGFGASASILQKGGPQVVLFLVFCTLVGALQNVLGIGAAMAMGQSPLFGVVCGSLTLMGGPSTGLTFAPQFVEAGINGADSIAAAAAIAGIVMGGILGTPVATLLIEKLRRKELATPSNGEPLVAQHVVEALLPETNDQAPRGEDSQSYSLLKNLCFLLIAMGIGGWISSQLASAGIKLPPYIGAMVIAAVIRNLNDYTGWFGISQATIDDLGNVALAFFLILALMTLKLWELAAVAVPLVVILALQVVLTTALAIWPIFVRFGRNYESAVIASGFLGFMLGTTPVAMANMDSLVRRFGPAPRAYLIVPLVGAFFIDFTNAGMIQFCIWLFDPTKPGG
jgi:glutamate:Na+ symporter, ESS family